MKDQEVIDMGWEKYWEEMEKDLSYVDVGILSKDGSESVDGGINLAKLATVHEYGTQINVTQKMRMYLMATGLPLKKETTQITIPARPFMRQTFDEQEPELSRAADRLEKKVLNGLSTKRDALAELGQRHRQAIQRNMKTKGKFEPNHPYTLDKKKPKTTPLIDTGRMRQAIDYEVG
ncbi:hypothetical protein KKI24_27670 [bacterium]|nr:hypothetical protein [bacterium]